VFLWPQFGNLIVTLRIHYFFLKPAFLPSFHVYLFFSSLYHLLPSAFGITSLKYFPLTLMMIGLNYFPSLTGTFIFRSVPEITGSKLNEQTYKQNIFRWISFSFCFGVKQFPSVRNDFHNFHTMFLGLERF
jgi:hypothetical protein